MNDNDYAYKRRFGVPLIARALLAPEGSHICERCHKPATMHEGRHWFCRRCWLDWVCEVGQK